MKSYCPRAILVGTSIGFALLTGCSTTSLQTSSTFPGPYPVVAYKPKDSNDVRVKVSLQNRMVYVMEGTRRERKFSGASRSCGQPFSIVTESRIPAAEGLLEISVENFCSSL
jgi:hypothetical protein